MDPGNCSGRVDGDSIVPTSDTDTFAEATVAFAPASLVESYFEGRTRGKTPLDIGTIRYGEGTSRAVIQATGFDRHTFLCGQSGSGKTYALGVVLERLLIETELPIIIIDPNSDFVNLGGPRAFDVAKRGFTGQFATAEEYEPARVRYERSASNVRVLRRVARGTSSEHALRVRFSDLALNVQGMVLQLDPLGNLEEFNAFNSIRSTFGDRPYSLSDVRAAAASELSVVARDLALRISNLGVEHWDIWAEADEVPILINPELSWRALVLDIGGFTNPEEQALVALAMLNAMWKRREARKPYLFVIDEAHTICPQEPANKLQAAATERAIQIAGEGRKFGIYFLVSTQRPQKLHANVISQCDNLFLMRMNSSVDIAHLAGSFSFVPQPLLASSSWFVQGESLIAGKVVPSPLLVRFGGRYSQEGGGDVPTDWAVSADRE